MYAAELKLISTLLKSLDTKLDQVLSQQALMLAEIAGLNARLESPLQVQIEQPHAIEPDPDIALHPVFDNDGREIDYGTSVFVSYPLMATCRCGRQITQLGPGTQWEHSD